MNRGDTSVDGGLSVSFPAFTSSGDASNVQNETTDSGVTYHTYPKGSAIHYKNGGTNTMTANYLLAEWDDSSFTQNESHTIKFKVTPQAVGGFVVYVRSTLSSDLTTYVNATPDSANATDQQNWSVTQYTVNVTAPPQPNLLPPQPSGWSDKIVVSKQMGTHTDDSPLLSTDTLYVDWAGTNNGNAGVGSDFSAMLQIDGVDKQGWSVPKANADPGDVFSVSDWNIGTLPVGQHTLTIKIDSLNTITNESNENDNNYTKTITISATPPAPQIWSVTPDPMPSSIVLGGSIDVTVKVINRGGTSIDGGLSVSVPSFTSPGDTAYFQNTTPSSSTISFGAHTQGSDIHYKGGGTATKKADYLLGEWEDSDFTLNETDTFTFRLTPKAVGSFVFNVRSALSADDITYVNTPTSGPTDQQQGWNVQQYTIQVNPVAQPNLLPTQPSGWSDKIVVSKQTGTHSDDSTLLSTDTLYVDWAGTNNGSAGVGSDFSAMLQIDGVDKQGWSVPKADADPGDVFSVSDWDIGTLPVGQHTLTIKIDSLNTITNESNESDNNYTRTITIGPGVQADLALTNLTVSPSTVTTKAFTGCSFNVVNNGPTALSSEGITVDYYLSANTTFGDGDDFKIGDTGHTVSIASGATYQITLSSTGLANMVRLWPDGKPDGNYYVFANVSVSDGSPSDPNSGNNNDRTDSTIYVHLSTESADLAASNLDFAPNPINAGAHPLGVSFTVTNNGPARLIDSPIVEEFYLSTDATFGNADDLKIGDNDYIETIAVNGHDDITMSASLVNVTIPANQPAGDYYVFVKVSHRSDSTLVDPNPGNNFAKATGTIHIDSVQEIHVIVKDQDGGSGWDKSVLVRSDDQEPLFFKPDNTGQPHSYYDFHTYKTEKPGVLVELLRSGIVLDSQVIYGTDATFRVPEAGEYYVRCSTVIQDTTSWAPVDMNGMLAEWGFNPYDVSDRRRFEFTSVVYTGQSRQPYIYNVLYTYQPSSEVVTYVFPGERTDVAAVSLITDTGWLARAAAAAPVAILDSEAVEQIVTNIVVKETVKELVSGIGRGLFHVPEESFWGRYGTGEVGNLVAIGATKWDMSEAVWDSVKSLGIETAVFALGLTGPEGLALGLAVTAVEKMPEIKVAIDTAEFRSEIVTSTTDDLVIAKVPRTSSVDTSYDICLLNRGAPLKNVSLATIDVPALSDPNHESVQRVTRNESYGVVKEFGTGQAVAFRNVPWSWFYNGPTHDPNLGERFRFAALSWEMDLVGQESGNAKVGLVTNLRSGYSAASASPVDAIRQGTITVPPSADLAVSQVLRSHADLNVYDPEERHLGVNRDTGQLDQQIPGATLKYYDDSNNDRIYEPTEERIPTDYLQIPVEWVQVAALPQLTVGAYRTELVGTSDGPFDLKIEGAQNGNTVTGGAFSGVVTTGQRFVTTTTVTRIEGTLTLLTEPLVGALDVESLTPKPSGFTTRFNRAIDPTVLNLYAAGRSSEDVRLVGETVGRVPGSLMLNADYDQLTFVATGGILHPDTYTLTLRSSDDGFRDLAHAELLDGEYNAGFPSGDGTPGGDFVYQFTVSAPASIVVGLPDFAQGPGQSAGASGLTIHLSNAAGVESVDFTLTYDPDLLNITAVSLGPDVVEGSMVHGDVSVPGQVKVSFFALNPMPAGAADIISLSAVVPSGATYGLAEVLHISDLRINEGFFAATADDAVHVVAYLGDATGNGGDLWKNDPSHLEDTYSGLDAQKVSRVAVRLDSGFAAYPLIDPLIIGDVTGDGTISGLDASYLLEESTGDCEEIPPLPEPPANAQPIATTQSVTTAEDAALAVTLAGDDGDPEVVQTLTYAIATQPAHGTLSGFNADTGAVTYTPNPDFNGTDSFTFTVTDDDKAGPTANLTSATATVTITATPVNKQPVANAQSVTTPENAAKAITLTGDDKDPMPGENQHLAFAITRQPVHGTIMSFDPSTGEVVYVPDSNYSNSGGVTTHPLTNPGAETGDLSGWDSTYNVSAVSGPRSLGTGTINATEGSFWFMGQKEYSYNTSISYGVIYMERTVDVSSFSTIASIHFGGDYSAHGVITDGTGTLQVMDYFYLWYYDESGAFLGSTSSFGEPWHDVTGQSYSEQVDHLDTAVPPNTVSIQVRIAVEALITNTAGGGTVSGTVLAGIDNLFMDVDGGQGGDSFGFILIDDNTAGRPYGLMSDEANVSITVTDVNDPPSFTKGSDQAANDDAGAQTVAGWATNISPGSPNESGQVLDFIVSVDTPALFQVQPAIDAITGTLTYTPAANANGSTIVTVRLHDNGGIANGGADTSAAETFRITVNPVNAPPTLNAIPDPAAINEDAGLQTVNLSGIGPGGGGDEAGQVLAVTATSGNTALIPNPTVNYTSPKATGRPTYTPVGNANGTTLITVTMTDNGGGSNSFSRTFTVTVNPVNDPPTAADAAVTTSKNTEHLFAASDFTFSDVDTGDALSAVQITTLATNGALKWNNGTSWVPITAGQEITKTDIDAGKLEFVPFANESGRPYATFGFQVKDTGGPTLSTFTYAMTANVTETLLAAGVAPADQSGTSSLTQADLQPIVNEAIAPWAAAGLSTQVVDALAGAQVVITDLPGDELGLAVGKTIYLDVGGAGFGWFIDPTPDQDEEFAGQSGTGELQAIDARAVDRMDLLSAVEHELGHLAGLWDLDSSASSLMSGSLRKGVRRIPGAQEVDAVLAEALLMQ